MGNAAAIQPTYTGRIACGHTRPIAPTAMAIAAMPIVSPSWAPRCHRKAATDRKNRIHRPANCRSRRSVVGLVTSDQFIAASSIELELREVAVARRRVHASGDVRLEDHEVLENERVHVRREK